MRNRRRFAWVLGCLTLTEVAAAVAVLSCGSGSSSVAGVDAGIDSTSGEDGGNDAPLGQDGTLDSSTGTEAGADTTTGTDSGPDGDASGGQDTGQDVDGGSLPDADGGIIPEAGADALPDVVTDDASDGGGDALAPDATAMLAFPGQVADAFCNRIQACCNIGTSAFNLALCRTDILGGGGFGITTETNLLDSGLVVFSPDAAQTCLARILSIDCSINSITTQQATAIFNQCFSALQGTLEAGAPCNGSIECAPSDFCFPADGGVGPSGTCVPLRTAGQGCGDFGGTNLGTKTLTADNACSYRSSGNTGLFCDFADLTTAAQPYLEAGAWQCRPQQPLDAGCYTDLECQSFVCSTDSPYPCVTARPLIPNPTCSVFVLPDAGTD